MIAVIDYDAGNIKSVEKALLRLGQEVSVTRDADRILGADGVILPGVGSFGDAMEKLRTYGLIEVIRKCADGGTPLLGICLGLQLLFESSEESPGAEGLHILEGKILRIPSGPGLKVPHIGWNNLTFPGRGNFPRKEKLSQEREFPWGERLPERENSSRGGRLFEGLGEGTECESPYVYFVHSYYLQAADEETVTATTEYGVTVHASVEKGNVFGCQFHPEKSSETGLRILRNFIKICGDPG